MLILAFTTSTDHGSIALIREGKILAANSWTRNKKHSDILNLGIKQILSKVKLTPKDLELIAVDRGPGSFTGSRMAVNIARALAYTLNIPVFSAYSLDIIAEGAKSRHHGLIYCLLNAHKSLTYGRVYSSDKKKTVPQSIVKAWTLEELSDGMSSKVAVFGDIPIETQTALKKSKPLFCKVKKLNYPQAVHLGHMAFEAIKSGLKLEPGNWSQVEPSYIRSPDAVEKLLQNQTKV